MKKMYTNKPVVNLTEMDVEDASSLDQNKRIEKLETKVRQLNEQLNRVISALALNSKAIRKNSNNIDSLASRTRG